MNISDSSVKLVEELHNRRVELGLTIKEMAWQMNVTYGCAYSLLVSNRIPQTKTAVKIKAFLEKTSHASGDCFET